MNAMSSVLVVDDDPAVRSLLLRMLQKEGYLVVLAKDGLDALSVLEESQVDVIVTDLSMPRMDGAELLTEARKRQPGARTLLMTGNGSGITPEVASRFGADLFLEKPFQQSAISSALRRLLSDDKAGDEV